MNHLSMVAQGGQGGQGAVGGDTQFCDGNSVGGDGGNGATGGGGGTIILQAATIDDPTVSEDISGGEGGEGGLGNFPSDNPGLPGDPGDDGSYNEESRGAETFSSDLEVDRYTAFPCDYLTYFVSVRTEEIKTNATLSLPLPANVEFTSASGSYRLEGGGVHWDFATLPACSVNTRKVRVRVFNNLTPGTLLSAQASVTSDQGAGASSDTVQVEIKAVVEPIEVEFKLGPDTNDEKGGDPVNTGIGNYVFQKTLLTMPGKTRPVSFGVTYNSLDSDYEGPLGKGWNHTYSIKLTEETAEERIRIKWSSGKEYTFADEEVGGAGAVASGSIFPQGTEGCGSGPVPVKVYKDLTLETEGDGWKASQTDGTDFHFGSGGLLTSITDLNGNVITLGYTADVLTTITDQAGRVLSLTYDGNGKLDTVTGPESLGLDFDVDASGNLVRITDARGNHYDMTYDSGTSQLTSLSDRRGINVLNQTYYADGRVHTQTDANSQTTTYAYDDDNLATTITPPSGNPVQHHFDAVYNQIKVTDAAGNWAGFTFDSNGQVAEASDKLAQNVSLTHDVAGNLTGFNDRNGASLSAVYNELKLATSRTDALGNTATMTYDSAGNLLTVTDPESGVYTTTYNGNGLPLTQTGPRNHTTTMTYNAAGQPATSSDHLGNTLSYTYDDTGRLTQVTYPTTPASTLQLSRDGNGNVTGGTNRLGLVFSATFDANDNLLSKTLDVGGIAARVSSAYNDKNLMVTTTDPMGGVTRFTYDESDNLKTITDPDGVTITRSFNNLNLVSEIKDELGNATSFSYDANGRLTMMTDPLGRQLTYSYDSEGRLTSFSDFLGRTTSYTYNAMGWITSMTDVLGRRLDYSYDKLGRLTQITDAQGKQIKYKYDANGNLTRLTDPKGHYWEMSYDALDRLSGRTDPLSHSESFGYDNLGNLTSFTDRQGRTITYSYDLGDRLTAMHLPGSVDVTYSYDNLGNQTSVTNPSGTVTMTYDKNGRRLTLTDANGKGLAWTYTPGGRLATMTYPGGKTLTFSFNAAGWLNSFSDWAGGVTGYSYDSLGRVTRVDLPNGTYTSYVFDAAGRLSSLTHRKSNDSLITQYTFTRDGLGRITSEEISGAPDQDLGTAQTEFTFDEANRIMTSQQGSVTTNYSFDHTGNLISKVEGSSTTDYGYDTLNQLVSVSGGGHTTGYSYDPLGNRIQKTYDGTRTNYLRDGTAVYCTYDDAGTISRFFVHLGHMLYSRDAAGNIQVYHADPRGSVVAVSDDSQTVVKKYTYGPYGRLIGESGSLNNPWQFVGAMGVAGDDNGLNHMHYRYYDPQLKRFINEDPLGLAGGLNLYSYVGGDPVNRADPPGLGEENPVWAATRAQRTVMAATNDIYKANEAYDLVKKYVKYGVPYEITDGVVKPLTGDVSKYMNRPALNLGSPISNPGYSQTTQVKPKPTYTKEQIRFMSLEQPRTIGSLNAIEGVDPCDIHGAFTDEELQLLIRSDYKREFYYSPITTGPKYQVVDRFTFSQMRAGIALENALIKRLGYEGAKTFLRRAGYAIIGVNLVLVAVDGYYFGLYMNTWKVWDSTSGQWTDFGSWVADRIFETFYEDVAPDNYWLLKGRARQEAIQWGDALNKKYAPIK